MKSNSFNTGILISLIVQSFCVCVNAQKLPDQYREDFSESFPIRKEQHLEIKAYVDELLEEKIDASLSFFNPDYFSIEDYENSLYPYRSKLSKYFGYPPPMAKEGKITKFVKAGEDKYTDIYRAWIEVAEGINAYGIYMVPKNLKGKAPLIIAQHGGMGNPEAICDLDTRINYHSFGHEAVKRGYIVWAPALIMKCDYADDPDIPEANRQLLSRKLQLAGTSIDALEIHKIIESTKTLIRNHPEIDVDRVGMTGLSAGGRYTMYTSALWPYIKVAVPSAFFMDTESILSRAAFGDSIRIRNQTPFERIGHFQAIGMICPRPCMVQMGETDALFSMEGAKKEAERAKQYYEKLGISNRFMFITHPGGHEFEIESIFDFINRHLK